MTRFGGVWRWLLGAAWSSLAGCSPGAGAGSSALFVVGGALPAASPAAPSAPAALPTQAAGGGDGAAVAPDAAVVPVPASGGGAGGGVALAVRGIVRDAGPGGLPVAGAWVLTTDGRRATTDAAGRFRLGGPWPADGLWAAGAPGRVTSVVAGFEEALEPTLHLRPTLMPVAKARGDAPRRVTLVGQVLGPDGAGRAGLVVTLGGPGVLGGIPVTTDARGEFTMSPLVDAASTAPASVVVVDPTAEALAVATGVVLTGTDQQLDLVPATPGLDPLRTVAARHALRIEATAPAGLPAARVGVDVVAPDGTSLPLYEVDGAFWLAELPGVRYALSATSAAADATAYSGVEVPEVPVAWGQAETRRQEALLAPPEFTELPALAPGARWRWAPVAGVRGYTLELTGDDPAEGLPWEGFTAAPGLTFPWPATMLPAGGYMLAVTAWDVPGLSARALAQVAGVRRLLPVPRTDALRYATRRVTLRR